MHFNRSTQADNQSTFIFLPCDRHPVDYYVVEKDGDSPLFKATMIEYPRSKIRSHVLLLCTNGLFCFTYRDFIASNNGNVWRTCIYNPARKDFVNLPRFEFPEYSITSVVCGFGFDRHSKDYKVVQIFRRRSGFFTDSVRKEVHLLTLGTNTWRELDVPDLFLQCPVSGESSAFVNGFVYWLSTNKQIMWFDMALENFGFIQIPESVYLTNYEVELFEDQTLQVINLSGCLSVADYSLLDRITIWTMKDYNIKDSWNKIIIYKNFVVDKMIRCDAEVRIISLWKKGEVLLLYDSRVLISYNLESKSYTRLQIDGLPEKKNGKGYIAFPYIGNLTSLSTQTDNQSTFLSLAGSSSLPSGRRVFYIVEASESSLLFKATKIKLPSSQQLHLDARCFVNGLLCFYLPTPIPEIPMPSSTRLHRTIKLFPDGHTYICNPGTRECVKLPSLNSTELKQGVLLPGFGFDHSIKQFKVVQMFYWCNKYNGLAIEAQVLTLGPNSWRNLKNVPEEICVRHSTVVVNGSVHWLTNGTHSILSFDLETENFGYLATPQLACLVTGYEIVTLRIMNLEGCLAITDSSYYDHIDVWIMKDYGVKESWSKVVSIRNAVEFVTILPISLGKNGEIILLCNSSILVSYKIESGIYTRLVIAGLPQYNLDDNKYLYDVHPYVGNLLSLQPAESRCNHEEEMRVQY
ncbi:hypothetical protein IFM89_015490 [Coptis chinensis]|uniref:F-box associated beta-propeller type 3 domain-containing protein n=1 Tax=Coptis chinensis TaxID=261450 RepID=A0A835H101_9MAGN|nr:hypothetical protein IFM89_015490 [Coptis chinensis]